MLPAYVSHGKRETDRPSHVSASSAGLRSPESRRLSMELRALVAGESLLECRFREAAIHDASCGVAQDVDRKCLHHDGVMSVYSDKRQVSLLGERTSHMSGSVPPILFGH